MVSIVITTANSPIILSLPPQTYLNTVITTTD